MARSLLRFSTLALAMLSMLAAYTASTSDTSRDARPVAEASQGLLEPHSASMTPLTLVAAKKASKKAAKRSTVMGFAKAQKGDRYSQANPQGPNHWDCSGIVQASYRKAGVTLPRTTYTIIGSSKLKQIPASQARYGDIVFTSSGHVELYSHKKNGVRWMFGSHNSKERVGYKRVYSGQSGFPKYFTLR